MTVKNYGINRLKKSRKLAAARRRNGSGFAGEMMDSRTKGLGKKNYPIRLVFLSIFLSRQQLSKTAIFLLPHLEDDLKFESILGILFFGDSKSRY